METITVPIEIGNPEDLVRLRLDKVNELVERMDQLLN